MAAAKRCFETAGIEKTTIVDIAASARYSRPVVYKHFNDKSDIIDAICLAEMEQVQIELASHLSKNMTPHDFLVEAISNAVILAHRNKYIQRFVDDEEAWVRSQNLEQDVLRWFKDRWEGYVVRGQSEGELASDITIDEFVGWIAMNQSQLLRRFRKEQIDLAWLKRYVSRFVVQPLIARPGA